jgi:hypothetical protein
MADCVDELRSALAMVFGRLPYIAKFTGGRLFRVRPLPPPPAIAAAPVVEPTSEGAVLAAADVAGETASGNGESSSAALPLSKPPTKAKAKKGKREGKQKKP